jgi:hypothetical protein
MRRRISTIAPFSSKQPSPTRPPRRRQLPASSRWTRAGPTRRLLWRPRESRHFASWKARPFCSRITSPPLNDVILPPHLVGGVGTTLGTKPVGTNRF